MLIKFSKYSWCWVPENYVNIINMNLCTYPLEASSLTVLATCDTFQRLKRFLSLVAASVKYENLASEILSSSPPHLACPPMPSPSTHLCYFLSPGLL